MLISKNVPFEKGLRILFSKLIRFEHTQAFWELIKTALDRADIKYIENFSFAPYNDLVLMSNDKNDKVFQIFEFLWRKREETQQFCFTE